jgi:hypothetical protein
MTTFTLTDAQTKLVHDWEANHDCKFRTNEYGVEGEIYAGAIGGTTEYIFIPTGLGNICKIRCICGATLDLTDYENW